VNFIIYLELPYVLNYNYIVVPFPTRFFVSAYLNGEGVQKFLTASIESYHGALKRWFALDIKGLR